MDIGYASINVYSTDAMVRLPYDRTILQCASAEVRALAEYVFFGDSKTSAGRRRVKMLKMTSVIVAMR